MISVLFVIGELGYGGAQKMLTFVANNIDRSKFSVSILNEGEEITVARKLNEDITLHSHPTYTGRGIRRIKEIKYLINLIKQMKPDVIVSFLNMPNLVSTIAGNICNVPVVISERGDPSRNMDLADRLIRKLESINSGGVFQTEGAMQYYPKKLQKKSVVIPNPVVSVESEYIKNSYKNKIRDIAFVGRFEKIQKRQDLMIDALEIVTNEYKDVKLHFWGDGADEDSVKELVNQKRINNNVEFHGKVSNVMSEIINMDMFVLSSDYEGIPNALIEAMSIGLPCISTDCSPGGARLLIDNEKNGLLVPTGDKISLANAIIRYITEPQFAQLCGENARNICVEFSEDKIINCWNEYLLAKCQK